MVKQKIIYLEILTGGGEMKKLLSTIDITSVNGVYRFYQYRDANPLPQIELYKVSGEKEIAIQNVYGEVKKLNDEFKFQIEHAPKNRKSPLNTRELSEKFIREYNRNALNT